jgi:hypothetical protein
MSKALETLLKTIGSGSSWSKITAAYYFYIEERNTMPQAEQEIEVSDDGVNWSVRKFAAFAPNGDVITENNTVIVMRWKHYRIPTPKKKWKVVSGANGKPFNILEEDYIAGDIITTFEY